jgi:hypothetical protein
VAAATEFIAGLDIAPEAKAFLSDKKGTEGHRIALDIRRKLWMYGDLSPKQVDLVAKLVAEEPERLVRAAAWAAKKEAEKAAETMPPAGKLTVTGEVLSTKWQDSDWGGSLKMLVKAGTFKLWGTVPSKLTVSKGDTVTFTAEVEPVEVGFGYYKRPTKAAVLAAAA